MKYLYIYIYSTDNVNSRIVFDKLNLCQYKKNKIPTRCNEVKCTKVLDLDQIIIIITNERTLHKIS